MKSLFFCRSSYNFFTTTYSVKNLVKEAKKNKHESLILLETNTLAGSLEFISECLENDIAPVVALEIITIDNSIFWLIPKNNKGLKKLFQISSLVSLNKNEIILGSSWGQNLFIVKPNLGAKYFEYIKAKNFKNTPIKKIEENIKIPNFKLIDRINNSEKKTLSLLNKLDNLTTHWELLSLSDITQPNDHDFIKEVNLKIESSPKELPHIDEKQSFELFRSLCVKGLKARLRTSKVPKTYYERLVMEMNIIGERKFYAYFLLFFDLVSFCREEGILVGPGRGSAAGSLVSYCLFITNIDPVKNNLIFERFLNPMRSNLPDIDLDIEDINRDKVMQYLYEKYGWDRVANITTYSTFGLKGAFREIGKINGLNNYQIKEVSKFLPSTWLLKPLSELLNNSNALLQKYVTSTAIKEALDGAEIIRHLPRHASIHAAGVILTNEKIYNTIPVYLNKDGITISQWKMEEIEKWGIPKLDLLGLRNLSIIKNTISAVRQKRGIDISITNLEKYDRRVYKLLSNAQVEGIFQLESEGMRRVLRKIKPSNIEQIGLVSALFRPGARDHIDECAKNKQNRGFIMKINPIIDSILESTFGVLVYQEQVMSILVEFSGMSFGEADVMRRIISKKDSKNLDKVKEKFFNLSGIKKHDINVVKSVWSDIVKFAGYGFNKSHAISYATISYWMSYLKVNYSLEFYMSLLTSFQMDSYKTLILKADAYLNFGIELLGPNINISNNQYLIYGNDIIAPLSLIRSVGTSTINEIIKDRTINGPFINYIDTLERFSKLKISTQTIVNIIKSGATSDIKMSTKTQLNNLIKTIQYIAIKASSLNVEEPFIVNESDNFDDVATWEVEAIGYNVSRSRIQILETLESKYTRRKFFMLKNLPNVEVPIIVYVLDVTEAKTKNGKKMLVLQLNDGIKTEKAFLFESAHGDWLDMKKGIYKIIVKASSYNEDEQQYFNVVKAVKKY